MLCVNICIEVVSELLVVVLAHLCDVAKTYNVLNVFFLQCKDYGREVAL